MFESRPLGVVAGHGRQIHIARPILLVADVALVFEDPQHRTDGGIARRLGEELLDFRGGRVSTLVEDVDDLPFTTAEVDVASLGHAFQVRHTP